VFVFAWMVFKMASCHCKLSMRPSRVKFITINLPTLKQKIMKSNFQIMWSIINREFKFRGTSGYCCHHFKIRFLLHMAGRSRVRFQMVSYEFSIDTILRPHYGPGVDSNINEYQEYFLGSKGGRCVGLTTLPLSCADCLEIWEPQPPGTPRAFPGL
jgi:hypothetical protein